MCNHSRDSENAGGDKQELSDEIEIGFMQFALWWCYEPSHGKGDSYVPNVMRYQLRYTPNEMRERVQAGNATPRMDFLSGCEIT